MRLKRLPVASSIRRVVSALLMALLFLVPTIDGAVCATDLGASADRTVISSNSSGNQQPSADFDGLCVHGHVHEVASMPKTMSAKTADWMARDQLAFRGPSLKSHDPGSLDRPPRA